MKHRTLLESDEAKRALRGPPIRRRRVDGRNWSSWRWYLDEVFVGINGETHYLWRAVDHEGEVVEVFVTKWCDRRAALKFLKRTMKRYSRPWTIVTDALRSCSAAMKALGNPGRQDCGCWVNNSAENSHQPFRRRDGAVQIHQDPAKIRRYSCLVPQLLQPPTPSFAPRRFQTAPGRRPGRVASTRSLRVLD